MAAKKNKPRALPELYNHVRPSIVGLSWKDAQKAIDVVAKDCEWDLPEDEMGAKAVKFCIFKLCTSESPRALTYGEIDKVRPKDIDLGTNKFGRYVGESKKIDGNMLAAAKALLGFGGRKNAWRELVNKYRAELAAKVPDFLKAADAQLTVAKVSSTKRLEREADKLVSKYAEEPEKLAWILSRAQQKAKAEKAE